MSVTTIVPLALKALTNEQLLAVYNRWSTKPCKKFEKRVYGEQRVAKLLDDLELSVEDACASPSDGYGGAGWGVAFPQEDSVESEQDPAEPPEATAEAIPDEPTELHVETAEPEPRTEETADLVVGGLPETSPEARVPRTTNKALGTTAQAIFDLASRETGASAKELMAATGWKAGPSWPNQFSRLSLRTGTRFHQQKVNGEMRYYLS